MRAGHERVRSNDDGQATVLVLAVVALTMVVIVALGRLGVGAVDAARARSAADAAALAGAAHGPSAAAELALANGGRLVSFVTTADGDVLVVVQIGHVTARARATIVLVPP
jgi:hypothetical protein